MRLDLIKKMKISFLIQSTPTKPKFIFNVPLFTKLLKFPGLLQTAFELNN